MFLSFWLHRLRRIVLVWLFWRLDRLHAWLADDLYPARPAPSVPVSDIVVSSTVVGTTSAGIDGGNYTVSRLWSEPNTFGEID